MLVWGARANQSLTVSQPAVRYTQKNKQTNKHTSVSVVCMCVWGSRANQRHTRHHRSSRVCEWSLHVCVRACVLYYFVNLSTVSVCLPVHTVTQTHTHTSYTKNTGKYMSRNDKKSTLSLKRTALEWTVSQCSATRKNTHTHPNDSPAKTSGGRTDNWLLYKLSTLYRGETES
jgi:hypothetical protein